MTGRVCLVTGTTHGIGLETARVLARAGCTVVMANRNPARAELVREHLTKTTGNPSVESLTCDLASLESVRACAALFAGRHRHLDLLINNAGVMVGRPMLSEDGFELTFAVNHLGPFLLTNLLVDALRAADGARVVTVASRVHARGSVALASPVPARPFRGMAAYAASKLANVMFTLALARRLRGTRVTANCLHPGVVGSNIAAEAGPMLSLGFRLARRFMRSPARGAETTLHLALSPALAGVSGRYFDERRRELDPAPAARDEAAQEALWSRSVQLTGLDRPG